jgi:flagellin-like protein
MEIKKRKAVTPVIATVLLILIVIILAVIILLWSQGFITEAITKDIGGETKTTEQFCSEISIQPILNNDKSFGFKNIGNVPIYSFNLKLAEKNTGRSEIKKIEHSTGAVNPGFSTLVKKDAVEYYNYTNYESVKIIPILIGKTKSGGLQEFECPEENGINI